MIQRAIKTRAVPILYSPFSGHIHTPNQIRPIRATQIMIRAYKGNFTKNSLANAAATEIFEKSNSVFDNASRLLDFIFITIINISYYLKTVKFNFAFNNVESRR